MIVQRGATALITGNLGPNAASALSASGIKVYLVPGGTVKDVIEGYKSGSLREASGATVPPHFGWEEAEAWVAAEVNVRFSHATNYSNKIFLNNSIPFE